MVQVFKSVAFAAENVHAVEPTGSGGGGLGGGLGGGGDGGGEGGGGLRSGEWLRKPFPSGRAP